MPLREFLQLAKEYEPSSLIGGWLCSEKLDGQRALWDGGVTRGVDVEKVPWANTLKDSRRIDGGNYAATGLWSRYGKVIFAPKWWLDKLPVGVIVDGELYCGRGLHQKLRSIVSEFEAGDGWRDVRYEYFALPRADQVFQDGEIRGTNFKKLIRWAECRGWFGGIREVVPPENEVLRALEQIRLPPTTMMAEGVVMSKLHDVTAAGGEGLMLRAPLAAWRPKRVSELLKVKKLNDSEAVVIGMQWGRETDKGSKLLGMMGALKLSWKGEIEFYLSGFTDEERGVTDSSEGLRAPGSEATRNVSRFPNGSVITFTYRELTDAGVPKEARYLRVRRPE